MSVDAVYFASLQQVEIDLATTEDNASRLFHVDRFDFGNDQLEAPTRQAPSTGDTDIL